MTLSEQSMNSSKLSSKASSRILGKVLAELNANQAHPSRDWKNDRNDRETFPDFSDCVEPVDEELPEWATAVVDRSSEGFFKDGMWQSADGKDEHSRGKVTWKKNHERRGHHARYQKRRQERENEAKACGQGKPNAPVAAGMVKGPPLSPTSTVNTMALPHQ
mmetsp:Transcript_577/g.1149  ORF Transcript_577/g.1149 Transcript_577/m.1149 type:complete len:162 (+) Transcript_577:84-569(+)